MTKETYLVYWCSHKNIISRSVHGAKKKSSLFKHRLSNLLLALSLRKMQRYLFSAKMLMRSDLDWIRAFLTKQNVFGFSNPEWIRILQPGMDRIQSLYGDGTVSINYKFVLLLLPEDRTVTYRIPHRTRLVGTVPIPCLGFLWYRLPYHRGFGTGVTVYKKIYNESN
jgi:hypothetical protein